MAAEPQVVAGDFFPLGKIGEQPAGAAAEVEPLEGRGTRGPRREKFFRDARKIVKLQRAIGDAPVVVFVFVVDVGVGALAPVIGVVVNLVAGKRRNKTKTAAGAVVEIEIARDEFPALPAKPRGARRAAAATGRGGGAHAARGLRRASQNEPTNRIRARGGGEDAREKTARLVAEAHAVLASGVEHDALERVVEAHDAGFLAVDLGAEIAGQIGLGEDGDARAVRPHGEGGGVFRELIVRGWCHRAARDPARQGIERAIAGEVSRQRSGEGLAVARAKLGDEVGRVFVADKPVGEKRRGHAVGLS